MRVLADEQRVNDLIDALAGAIGADIDAAGGDRSQWAIVGIRSRGDVIARRLADRLEIAAVGTLDITLYRDDLSEVGSQPVVRTTEIPFSIDGMNLVLIDDVIMSGRSIRAALASLLDLGRAKRIWLAVLVDRGGRELPICPDHVALDVCQSGSRRVDPDAAVEPLANDELVAVHLTPTDETDQIVVHARAKATGGDA